MAQDFARKFYDSKEWRKCRKAYIAARIAIDGGMCEKCHERLGFYVHHKVFLTMDNITDSTISLNHDLLEYVCKHCHDREEGHFLDRGKKEEKKYIFDANGCPVPRKKV